MFGSGDSYSTYLQSRALPILLKLVDFTENVSLIVRINFFANPFSTFSCAILGFALLLQYGIPKQLILYLSELYYLQCTFFSSLGMNEFSTSFAPNFQHPQNFHNKFFILMDLFLSLDIH